MIVNYICHPFGAMNLDDVFSTIMTTLRVYIQSTSGTINELKSYSILNSVRLFFARPSSVWFESIGFVAPNPAELSLSEDIPSLIK